MYSRARHNLICPNPFDQPCQLLLLFGLLAKHEAEQLRVKGTRAGNGMLDFLNQYFKSTSYSDYRANASGIK